MKADLRGRQKEKEYQELQLGADTSHLEIQSPQLTTFPSFKYLDGIFWVCSTYAQIRKIPGEGYAKQD